MKWAPARTHPTIICSVENFNRIFCILHHISRIKSNLDDWKLHSEQFIISYQCVVNRAVSCHVMAFVLFACTCYVRYMKCDESTCTDVSHFYQFSPPHCNLITLANFHAAHHIWLERFIAIVHPVKCCSFISYSHTETILITHLCLLLSWCI